ncbi:hypothetical protein [Edaphobacter acidisoli]|uniref:hypothetical protein n=1 Tax=Edaphobacter acidisoli TaxID=2040573 RepID=UPI001667AA15|nr:hypothetical protein [Edaphobacter acidisoli]
MIVVIATKDGYWIGADSYRSGGDKHIADVCKIHETRFGLLAKSGDAQGANHSGEIYSTDKEVEDLIASSKDLETFQSNLRLRYEHDIDEELALLVDDPSVTSENIEQIPMGKPIPHALIPTLLRMVVMFNTKATDVSGEVLLVRPESDELTDALGRNYYHYSAPSTLGWYPLSDISIKAPSPHFQVSCPASVHEFSYFVPCEKPDPWIQKHPKETLKRLLDQAHRREPETIGPPYTIVRVILRKSRAPKVKWISKGVCPGWSESVDPKYSLIERRDDMRKQRDSNP